MQLLLNARIYTLDPGTPTAEAIAFDRDRILAVGSQDEIWLGSTSASGWTWTGGQSCLA
jgi:predicted amidohydrolase YtcJ